MAPQFVAPYRKSGKNDANDGGHLRGGFAPVQNLQKMAKNIEITSK